MVSTVGRWLRAGALIAFLSILAAGARPSAQCETPLGEGDLKELIAAGVPPLRMRQLIATCGIDLGQPDAAALEARLRQLGAPNAVLAALYPPEGTPPQTAWMSPVDRQKMVFVPSGRFQMGSPASEPNRDPDETAHDVTLDTGFWIDTVEVTNEAFQRFVLSRPEWQKGNTRLELSGADYLKDWDGNSYPPGQADQSVTRISWHAARAYAAWAGKRLPTEAEWEYVARAGALTAYWWGDEFDARKVAGSPSSGSGEESRQLRTNRWGLRDTLGGVWEWTASLYRAYPFVLSDGRDDPRAPGARVIRGGASSNGPAFLRLSNRNQQGPAVASDLVGFRCSR